MQETKLFAVGDLCVDILCSNGRARLGEEHALSSLNFSVGGNAANFSVIAGKIGLKPKLFSAIGRDFATQFLMEQMLQAGIELHLVRSARQNSYSLVWVNKKGERAIQSIKNCLGDLTAKKTEKKLLKGIRSQDIVFFGGFFHLKNFREGFSQLLQKLKQRHAIICFDTCFDTFGNWNILPYFRFIDFLFTNETELGHIAAGKSVRERINFLFRNGANTVVLKQGSRGATLFKKDMKPVAVRALRAKVVDTTAAGDAFNAGFAFGLLNCYGMRNCLHAAAFVAGEKVQQHGLAAPRRAAVEQFVAVNNRPLLIVEANYGKMCKRAASLVVDLLSRKPDAAIAIPTGETPKGFYKILVSKYKKGEVDFSRAKFFALDEYAGLGKDDRNSSRNCLERNFLGGVNARKENTFMLDGAARNRTAECRKYEARIRKTWIDLAVLGIGQNAHIAFNEPGSGINSVTRVAKLKEGTRKSKGKDFPCGMAPAKALTVGLGTIRNNARQVLLIANGKHKAAAVASSLKSMDFTRFPAATLQLHKNVTFVVDRPAAAKI